MAGRLIVLTLAAVAGLACERRGPHSRKAPFRSSELKNGVLRSAFSKAHVKTAEHDIRHLLIGWIDVWNEHIRAAALDDVQHTLGADARPITMVEWGDSHSYHVLVVASEGEAGSVAYVRYRIRYGQDYEPDVSCTQPLVSLSLPPVEVEAVRRLVERHTFVGQVLAEYIDGPLFFLTVWKRRSPETICVFPAMFPSIGTPELRDMDATVSAVRLIDTVLHTLEWRASEADIEVNLGELPNRPPRGEYILPDGHSVPAGGGRAGEDAGGKGD